MLTGFIRIDNNGDLKLSINVDAFEDCERYITSDGQQFVALTIKGQSMRDLLRNERPVTTINHLRKEDE